jgi:serine/threonine-protein kinase PpkA
MDIPGYKIERKLGQGGMAEVYLATQESLGRQVALKITSQSHSQDPAFKERFFQEGHIVATLNHPNIVTIHEIGQVDEHYFIAMEYVAGKSLSEKIVEGMTLENSIQTVQRIARALAYAHKGGFLHRDIKPSNILFRDDEYAVLADFGIATEIVDDDTRLTLTGISPGSPAYMSPEQVNGDALDGRSDQYSLGIVFYEMLTGERPYRGNSATATAVLHLTAPIPQLRSPYEALQPVFDRLLAKTPDERFADEDALIQALDDPSSVEPRSVAEQDKYTATVMDRTQVRMDQTRVANPVEAQPPRKPMLANKRRWGSIAALSTVLMAAAVFWLKSPRHAPDAPALASEAPTVQEQPADLSVDRPETEISQTADLNARQTDSPEVAQEPADSQIVEQEAKVAQEAEPSASQESTDLSTVEAEAEVRQKADRNAALVDSLATAQTQMKAGRYMKPAGDNAFETYTGILVSDASNAAALQGLTQIAQNYEQQARVKQSDGDLEKSLAFADLGLKVEPEHPGLTVLREEVTNQQKIEALMANAEAQLAGQRLTRPKGDNAYESYQAILAVDAGNQQAQAGLLQVAQNYEQFAQNKHKAGDLSGALAMAELGLEVDPEHAGLLVLRKQIATLLDTGQGSQAEIERLLAIGQQQFDANQLTQPKGENARETYDKVLKMAPMNKQARTGLNAITQRYNVLVRDKQSAGDTAIAFSLVKEGLQAFPKHSGLRSLHEEIESQLKEAKQAKIPPAEPQPKAPADPQPKVKKASKEKSRTRVFGTF